MNLFESATIRLLFQLYHAHIYSCKIHQIKANNIIPHCTALRQTTRYQKDKQLQSKQTQTLYHHTKKNTPFDN